jgi:[ribosomal protein S5]-alanine N-acetyltransferase
MRLVTIGQDGRATEEVPASTTVDEVGASYAALYASAGYVPPWTGYFAIDDAGNCIGSCGFKGPPVHERVEIAYFTFPEHEGSGVATRMAAALVRIAHEADPHLMIAARTQPQEGPSTAVLRRLGFHNIGKVQDTEDGTVWEWQLE